MKTVAGWIKRRKNKCGIISGKAAERYNINQTANFTYTVPTNKIPALDWTTMRLGYGSSYQWTGASTLATTVREFYSEHTEKRCDGRFEFYAAIWQVAIASRAGTASGRRST